MKKLILLGLLMNVGFFSCRKDHASPNVPYKYDWRDKYLGDYSGTRTQTDSYIDMIPPYNHTTTSVAHNSHVIVTKTGIKDTFMINSVWMKLDSVSLKISRADGHGLNGYYFVQFFSDSVVFEQNDFDLSYGHVTKIRAGKLP